MRAILVLALLAIAAVRLEAAEFAIVADGKSGCVVVTPAAPTMQESYGAAELVHYVEQMSGVKLAIQNGGPATKNAIIIAEQAHLHEWASAPKTDLTGDAYAIIPEGTHLWLVGGRGRSTLYAVYDLLDRLGCRFLAPSFGHYQGSGEIIPKKPAISIGLISPVIERPALPIRKLYVEEGHSHNAENLPQMVEWMAKARFSTLVVPTNYQGGGVVKWDNWREKLTPELQKRDIIIEVGGHGYQNFMNSDMENGTLFQKHPEWFGADARGVRHPDKNRVLCTSNPEAVKYMIGNFLDYVKARPEIQVFDLWPPDGAHWCECDKCKALGTPSNRQAIFIAQVKAEVSKARSDLRLECIAYSTTVAPPESAKLDKDLLIDFCPIGQCFEVQINDPSSDKNAEYVTQLKGLRKGFEGDISIYSYYRKYAWKSLPNLIPHYMQNDLKFYQTIPTQGISSYAEPGDWFTYELNHYTLSRLAWDPSADVDGIISKFAEARYGPASKEAVRAYAVLEDVVRHNCCIPGTTLKSIGDLTRAQVKLVQEAAALKAAQAAVTDASVRRNMDRLLLTFEYARLDIQVQGAKASLAPQEQIRARIKDVADFLSAHAKDGIVTIHTRVEFPRIIKTYGVTE